MSLPKRERVSGRTRTTSLDVLTRRFLHILRILHLLRGSVPRSVNDVSRARPVQKSVEIVPGCGFQ